MDSRLLELQREKSFASIRRDELWIEPDRGDIPLIRFRAFGSFFPRSLDGVRAALVVRTAPETRVEIIGTLTSCYPSRSRGTWYPFTFDPDTKHPLPIVYERSRHVTWSNIESVVFLPPLGDVKIMNPISIWKR